MNRPFLEHGFPIDTAAGKIIPTRYAGHVFRSRTEARWCVFFDALGMQWEYELEGIVVNETPYLPDFYIPEWKAWFEVKPMAGMLDTKLLQTLVDLRKATDARGAYLIYRGPDLIRGNLILAGTNTARPYTHIGPDGPTRKAPETGPAYDAYRRAMEERFERRP